MKRFAWLLFACLQATCSSSGGLNDSSVKTDSGGPPATIADAAVAPAVDAVSVDTADSMGTDAGTTVSGCPSGNPVVDSACTSEGAICEYSLALSCPVGCSGGDFHSYQCSKGRWIDYRHSAGAPRCYCRALDFPKDMQGTWRFNQSGSPEQYAWIRFSALGDSLGDATRLAVTGSVEELHISTEVTQKDAEGRVPRRK